MYFGNCHCGKLFVRLSEMAVGCPLGHGKLLIKKAETAAQCYREMIIEPLPEATKTGKKMLLLVHLPGTAQFGRDVKKKVMTYTISGCEGLYRMNPGGRRDLDDTLHKNSLGLEFETGMVAAKLVRSDGLAVGRVFTPIK